MKKAINIALVLALIFISKSAFAYSSYCAIGQTPAGYKTIYHQANWSSWDFLYDPNTSNYVYIYTEVTAPVYGTRFTWFENINFGGVETHYLKNPPDGYASGTGWIEINNQWATCGGVTGSINNTPPVSVWFTPGSTLGVGSTATVNWSSSGASSCTYNGGNPMPGNALSGSHSFTATVNVTYTVSCLGPLGEDNYGPLGSVGQAAATLTVVDYCSSSYINDTNSTAISVALNNWYTNVGYERGVSIFCNSSNGAHSYNYFSDSFGNVGSWYVPTMDPCKTTLAGGLSQLRAGLHSHPYFSTSAEFTAGVGCHGNTDFQTNAQLSAYNLANRNFGEDDGAWISQTSTPLYLLVPLGNSVKRKDTVIGSGTTVYP